MLEVPGGVLGSPEAGPCHLGHIAVLSQATGNLLDTPSVRE
jgi:hypothetical protein